MSRPRMYAGGWLSEDRDRCVQEVFSGATDEDPYQCKKKRKGNSPYCGQHNPRNIAIRKKASKLADEFEISQALKRHALTNLSEAMLSELKNLVSILGPLEAKKKIDLSNARNLIEQGCEILR